MLRQLITEKPLPTCQTGLTLIDISVSHTQLPQLTLHAGGTLFTNYHLGCHLLDQITAGDTAQNLHPSQLPQLPVWWVSIKAAPGTFSSLESCTSLLPETPSLLPVIAQVVGFTICLSRVY